MKIVYYGVTQRQLSLSYAIGRPCHGRSAPVARYGAKLIRDSPADVEPARENLGDTWRGESYINTSGT